jgi:hypothetical protein
MNNEKPLEDSPLHCGSVYHLVRLTGNGSDYVLPLYDLSMRVAANSGRFFPRMTALAPYLKCDRARLSEAAKLLVGSGFWVVIEKVLGKAVQYRPLGHEDWVAVDPARAERECCTKMAMPWDGEEQDQLGKALHGATGGVKFFPNVLAGFRNTGLTDEEIVVHTKQFMESPAYAHTHDREHLSSRLRHDRDKAFRKALGAALKEASKK